jgi:hypothetical protein
MFFQELEVILPDKKKRKPLVSQRKTKGVSY